MCRLFGMSAGSQRASATFWLLDAPDSLATQSRREPDGTGLGWFAEDGEPRVSKQPIAAYEDRAFAGQAKEVVSRTFVAHIRFASTGGLLARNTHPFVQDGRLFAHNGVIEDLAKLERHLGVDIKRVQGDTDSERFFALISRETAAHGGDIAEGILRACDWIAQNLPVFAMNFVLTTSDELFALRYPETHELYALERTAGKELAHHSSFGTRVLSGHGAEHPLVTVASERMDEDPGWRLLDSGELLRVRATLEVSRAHPLDAPPAQLLTINDLHGRAQASQTST
jgi:predicted glutamine amidotransferase